MAKRKTAVRKVANDKKEVIVPEVEELVVEVVEETAPEMAEVVEVQGNIYKNTRRGAFVIGHLMWKAGEEKETPEILLDDKQFLHAVKLGQLVKV